MKKGKKNKKEKSELFFFFSDLCGSQNQPQLQLTGIRDLHPPRAPDRRVRHVPVPADLVRRVHDHHALVQLVRQHARHLPDDGRLAHSRPAQEQDRVGNVEDVADQGDVSRDGPPHAAGQADDGAPAVADRRDAVERALHARPVVAAKLADGALGRGEVLGSDLGLAEELAACRGRGRGGGVVVGRGRAGLAPYAPPSSFLAVVRAAEEARLGPAPEVEHHLEQRRAPGVVGDGGADVFREGQEQGLEVVADGDGAVLLLEDVYRCVWGGVGEEEGEKEEEESERREKEKKRILMLLSPLAREAPRFFFFGEKDRLGFHALLASAEAIDSPLYVRLRERRKKKPFADSKKKTYPLRREQQRDR